MLKSRISKLVSLAAFVLEIAHFSDKRTILLKFVLKTGWFTAKTDLFRPLLSDIWRFIPH